MAARGGRGRVRVGVGRMQRSPTGAGGAAAAAANRFRVSTPTPAARGTTQQPAKMLQQAVAMIPWNFCITTFIEIYRLAVPIFVRAPYRDLEGFPLLQSPAAPPRRSSISDPQVPDAKWMHALVWRGPTAVGVCIF